MNVRGYEFEIQPVKDSYVRRAVRFANQIISTFTKLGISVDDIEISNEANPVKREKAHVSWYIEGNHCNFSHSQQARYIDNLHVLCRVIEHEVGLVMDGKKTVEQLIFEYSEDHDFEDKRLKAREILQVSQDCKDIDAINLQFKRLSKQSHPDMPEGSDEKFKQINWAVKTLRKELA